MRPDGFDPKSDWPTVAAHVNLDDLDADTLWQEWVDAGDDDPTCGAERTT